MSEILRPGRLDPKKNLCWRSQLVFFSFLYFYAVIITVTVPATFM